MNHHTFDNDTLSCTAVGTLLVLLNGISAAELLNTVVIAATGALVSFIVTICCKFIWHKIKENG